jgi:hypothetical protein
MRALRAVLYAMCPDASNVTRVSHLCELYTFISEYEYGGYPYRDGSDTELVAPLRALQGEPVSEHIHHNFHKCFCRQHKIFLCIAISMYSMQFPD